MNKYLFFLIVAVFLFAPLGLVSTSQARKNQAAFAIPAATPKISAEIERIETDRNEVIYIGPYCRPEACGAVEILSVQIKTIVRNPKNLSLTYEYTVTGGKIIGEGANVTWDLNGSRPQDYTITAAIKGKRGVSAATRTESITVRECQCCGYCVCPALSLTGGENVKAGETATFTANVEGGTAIDLRYNWTISQGEIVEGQGTAEIKVKTSAEMTGNITATVEIVGSDLCSACPSLTADQTVEIIK